uniref:GOLD domain-containing protein n=1 Tax=Strongyloides papillosus TaxID=174720 RepID=A0A0N5B988_STREA
MEFYCYDGDDTVIAYNVYFNESKEIDFRDNVSSHNGKYDLEGDGVGIGVYKICFKVLHTTYQIEPIYFSSELLNDESANVNGIETSNSVGNGKEKSGVDIQLDKVSSYLNEIEMAQSKYRQFEHISRENAEETFTFTNYCNLIILIVSLLTYITHIYVIKALFDSNSLPAKIMRRIY